MISKEDYICSICLQLLIEPCKLGCNHIFCQSCLKDIIKFNNITFKCPMCRALYQSSIQLKVDEALKKIIFENYSDEYKKRKQILEYGFVLLPNQLEIKVIYGNRYKFHGDNNEENDQDDSSSDNDNNHQWTVYTRLEYQNEDDKLALKKLDLNSLVRWAHYKLDESFVPDSIIVNKQPFELMRWGWDVFSIPITIKFKQECKIEPIKLEHHLVFENNGVEKCEIVRIDISNLKEYKQYQSNLQTIQKQKIKQK